MTDLQTASPAPDGYWVTTAHVAKMMHLDPGSVRKHYERFGGVRVGDLYRFPPDFLTHLRAHDAQSDSGMAAS